MRLAIVGALIGAGWAIYGATLLPQPAPALLIAIALIVSGSLIRRARHAGPWRGPAPMARHRRLFVANLAFEVVLLNIAAGLCVKAGRPDLMIPAISIAVGLHFVPMAAIYRQPRFVAVAGAMIAGAVLALGAIEADGPARIVAGEALLNAVILWVSVASTLRPARR